MSVTYRANVVYGVRKLRSSILKDCQVRNCNDKVEGSPKFCPECGKPFMRTRDLSELEEEFEGLNSLRFYGNGYSDDCNSVVVGILVAQSDEGSEPNSFEMPNEEARNALFEDLRFNGFAENISELRLFNILYVAC